MMKFVFKAIGDLRIKFDEYVLPDRANYMDHMNYLQNVERDEHQLDQCTPFPREILILVFSFLDMKTLLDVGIVSKNWYLASCSDTLWSMIFIKWNNKDVKTEWETVQIVKDAKWKFIEMYYNDRDVLLEQRNQSLSKMYANRINIIEKTRNSDLIYDPFEAVYVTKAHFRGYTGFLATAIAASIVYVCPFRIFSRRTVFKCLFAGSIFGAVHRFIIWDAYVDSERRYKWKVGRLSQSLQLFLYGLFLTFGTILTLPPDEKVENDQSL